LIRLPDLAVSAGFALAWLGGAILFPHALEPGRAEQNGIVLNLLVDRGEGSIANDWYTATPVVRVIRLGDRLRLEQHDSGLQIISRPLAVFPGECYAFNADGIDLVGTTHFIITDEEIRRAISQVSATPSSLDAEWRTTFNTTGFRRISVALIGQEENVLEVDQFAIERLGTRPPCP